MSCMREVTGISQTIEKVLKKKKQRNVERKETEREENLVFTVEIEHFNRVNENGEGY